MFFVNGFCVYQKGIVTIFRYISFQKKCNEKFKDILFVSKDASSYEEKEIEVVFVQFQKDKVVRNSGAYQLLLNFCY